MVRVGESAPAFRASGIDGSEYVIPCNAEAQPVLLVFFKTTCATCDLTFPYISRLRQAYPDGWRLWAVSQHPVEQTREYAAKHGMSYPVLVDEPGFAVSLLYDPPATPTLVLVDGEGQVAHVSYGFAKEDLNEVAGLIASWLGRQAQMVAPDGDGRPAMQPG